MRFLVVGEDADGEEVLFGRCAGVEGLFADAPPPAREVLVVRGCEPGPQPGRLGPASIAGRTASGFAAWWTLADAEILAVAPSHGDAARVDVVVGAGVLPTDGHRNADGPFVCFELTTSQGAVAAVGGAVPGLAADRAEPDAMPLRLVGCEPAEPMRAVLRKRRGAQPGYTELWALDDTGRVMDRRAIGLDIEWTRPSVLGGALVDVLVTVDADDALPGTAAREVWRQWLPGRPQRPGSWRGFGAAGRHAWLMLAMRGDRPSGPDRSGGEYHLEGSGLTDVPGLHCALGEAIRGPGGYFGWGFDAFSDSLCGGFGTVPPFTLVWHDFATTEGELAAERCAATGLGYPEVLASEMERHGVTVVRA